MLDFLEIYFACNGSVQAISQKLFIHKNTVQYKIKKMCIRDRLHLLQHGAYAGKICAVFQKFLFHVFLRSGKGRQNAALFLIICGIKLLW